MTTSNLASKIAKIPQGYLDEPIFHQILRLGVQAALEIVPLRMVNNQIEVCLTKRKSDDPFWPNMYHNPGTVLRPNDDSEGTLLKAYERIIQAELGTTGDYTHLYFEGLYFKNITRGVGLGIVCWQVINDCSGEYFSINSLPCNTIDFQLNYIHKCAKAYASSGHNDTILTRLEDVLL